MDHFDPFIAASWPPAQGFEVEALDVKAWTNAGRDTLPYPANL
jgi:hypothetical protein